jgi:hypothetical protein
MDSLDEAIKAEMRLQALENIVCILTALCLGVVEHIHPDVAQVFEERIRQSAKTATSAELDPVMSDHVSAELEDALERLLGLIRGHLQKQ